MPYIEIKTNKKIDITNEIAMRASLGEAITAIEGKSEKWLMLSFVDGLKMAFAGSDDGCAMVSVEIFGSADDEEYDELTARITAIVSNALSLPPDRIYVKYAETDHWGFDGENF